MFSHWFLGGKAIQKRPFVHNSVCSQFLEGLFAILFEVLSIEIQEEIHHFAGWEGGVGVFIGTSHFFSPLHGLFWKRGRDWYW